MCIEIPEPRELQSRFFLSLLPGRKSDSLTELEFQYRIDDKFTGTASLIFWPEDHRIEWFGFYPYPKKETKRRGGLGTLAHTATLLEIARQYTVSPNDLVYHNLFLTSRSRQLHLAAMGIPCATPLPFGEYLDRSLRYASSRGFSFPV